MPCKNKMLVVDDQKNIIELFNEFFSRHFEIESALNGQKALELLEKEDFDIVISDISLPDFSGMKVLEFAFNKIKKAQRVAMSGDLEENYNSYKEKGIINMFLQKPLSIKHFNKIYSMFI
jgi:DNA-binding NtrC family response regulator